MRLCNIQRDVIIVGNMKYMQMYDVRVFEETMRRGLESFDNAHAALNPDQPRMNPEAADPNPSSKPTMS